MCVCSQQRRRHLRGNYIMFMLHTHTHNSIWGFRGTRDIPARYRGEWVPVWRHTSVCGVYICGSGVLNHSRISSENLFAGPLARAVTQTEDMRDMREFRVSAETRERLWCFFSVCIYQRNFICVRVFPRCIHPPYTTFTIYKGVGDSLCPHLLKTVVRWKIFRSS